MTATKNGGCSKAIDKARIAVIIDAPNVHHGGKGLVDFGSLIAYFFDHAKKIRADVMISYITATWDGTEVSAHPYGKQSLLKQLENKGATVVTRPSRDNSGWSQSNMDVAIATELMRARYEYRADIIFLLSGDSDFKYTVEILDDSGALVYVVADRETIKTTYRKALGSSFIDLAHLLSDLKKWHLKNHALETEKLGVLQTEV